MQAIKPTSEHARVRRDLLAAVAACMKKGLEQDNRLCDVELVPFGSFVSGYYNAHRCACVRVRPRVRACKLGTSAVHAACTCGAAHAPALTLIHLPLQRLGPGAEGQAQRVHAQPPQHAGAGGDAADRHGVDTAGEWGAGCCCLVTCKGAAHGGPAKHCRAWQCTRPWGATRQGHAAPGPAPNPALNAAGSSHAAAAGPQQNKLDQSSKAKVLRWAKDLLLEAKIARYQTVLPILHARVPIIKFRDVQYGELCGWWLV